MTHQVYEDIRQSILEGEIPEGRKLPSEPECCQAYNVSRTTVREAYSMLQQEGIVEVRRGSGRFVLPGAAGIMKGSANLIRSTRELLEAKGYTPEIKVLSVQQRAPTAEESIFFEAPTNQTVVQISRAYFQNGELLTYSDNVVSPSIFPDWKTIDWSASMRAIVGEHDLVVQSAIIEVAAVTLPPEIENRYETPPERPWLRTTGPHYDHGGRTLWWSSEYCRGDIRTVRIVNREIR
jgi:GntR family transcriptional regulator